MENGRYMKKSNPFSKATKESEKRLVIQTNVKYETLGLPNIFLQSSLLWFKCLPL
jgi:hypothetical protein